MKKTALFFLSLFPLLSFSQNNVGIGTTTPNPAAQLHLDLGNSSSRGLLVTGTVSGVATVPNLGAGSRLMFYPAKAAFRAGAVDGIQWDDANVGYNSTALGSDTRATGFASTAIGSGATASGNYATALGLATTASGAYATAMGNGSNAVGQYSTALGGLTTASGFVSIAAGLSTTASGTYSFAMGFGANAAGQSSTAIGETVLSRGFSSMAIGTNNDPLLPSEQTALAGNTPLFLVGNGNVFGPGKNAFVVKADGFAAVGNNTRNGKLSVMHTGNVNSPALLLYDSSAANYARLQLQNASGNKFWQVAGYTDNVTDANSRLNFYHSVQGNVMSLAGNGNVGIGTSTPATRLDVAGGNWDLVGTEGDARIGNNAYRLKMGVATGGGGAGAATIMQFGQPGGYNVLALGAQGNSVLYVNGPNNSVGIGTDNPSQKLHVVGNICATGTIGACSDIRYKTGLTPLTGALSSVMKIQPLYYHWKQEYKDKGFTTGRQLGFSAQEIEQFFPEIVQTGKDGYKAVDYSRMTPVLLQAVKEQQGLIEKKEEQVANLEQRVKNLEEQLGELEMLKAQVSELLKKK